MGRSVDHRCGGAGSRSLRQRHPTRSRPVLSAEPRPRSPRSRLQHGRRAPRPEPRSARPGDLRVPEHPVHRLGPAHAGAVAAQGSDQGDAGVPPVYGYEAKWVWDRPEAPLAIFQCPARVPAGLYREIERTALDAYHALGCRDWCRVDLRVDRFGVPNVLELNPLPGIIPDPAMNSCFPKAARAAGFGYDELIQEVVRIAWRRLAGQELTVDAGTRRAVPAQQRAVVGA